MQHSDGSDEELMERARAGSATAFAVLLHRHGPAVREVVADDRDPTGAVIGTFVTAMRRLPHHPVDDTPRDWLLGLAAAEVRRPRAPATDPTPELEPDELDDIWAELDLRWPNGKVPRSLPRWVGWSAMVLALAALAVLVPYTVLTIGANGDERPEERTSLVARPFEEQPEEEPDEEFEDDLEPPPFEFPDVELESEPALGTEPTVAPAPVVEPLPVPTSAPASEPVAVPVPAPTPTQEPAPDPEPASPSEPEPEPAPEQPSPPPSAPGDDGDTDE